MTAQPANPPRTQEEILEERMAACRDLRGQALKDCLANYVGTPDKSQMAQPDNARAEKPERPPSLPSGQDQSDSGTTPKR